jgi:peptide deformylase
VIKTKDIIDEYDKRIRLVSKEVTFPLDDKTKKVIKDSLEMLRLSQIDEEAKKYNLRPGMGLSLIQLGIAKRIFVICYEIEEGKFEEDF